MTMVVHLPNEKLKIIFLAGLWIIVTSLLFSGIIEVNTVGHIEISAVVGLAMVLFGLHLFSFLKHYATHIK